MSDTVQPSPRVHFHGLDAVRGFAALLVLVHHIELYKYREHHASLFDTAARSAISIVGNNSVSLFFVLSGFLITFLLLDEHANTGTINVSKFYVRRILRIWPVYYLTFFLSLLMLPIAVKTFPIFDHESTYMARIAGLKDTWKGTCLLYGIMLPNFALARGYLLAGMAQSWSVGVEEQFYLVWPLVVVLLRRRFVWVLLFLALGKPLLEATVLYGTGSLFILRRVPIEYMAMGGLAALQWARLKSLDTRTGLFIAWLLAAGGTGVFLIHPAPYLFRAAAFALFVLLTSLVAERRHEPPLLRGLGRISYGFYMYHPIIMFGVFACVHSSGSFGFVTYNLLVYGGVFLGTCLAALVSHTYFERRFLALKLQYTVVQG